MEANGSPGGPGLDAAHHASEPVGVAAVGLRLTNSVWEILLKLKFAARMSAHQVNLLAALKIV